MSTLPPSNDPGPDETVIRARAAHPPAPPTPPPTSKPTPARRRVVIAAASVLGLAIVAYVVGYLAAGDRLPANATISGVAVGGLAAGPAAERLAAELGPRAREPLALSAGEKGAGEKDAELDPVEAGLTVDYPASVAAAGGGRSFSPAHIVTVLTGGGATDAVVAVDQAKLTTAVRTLVTGIDQQPADAKVAYAGTKVKQTAARTGLTTQVEATEEVLQSSFLRPGSPIALPVDIVEPEITDAEATAVATGIASQAVAKSVTVRAGAAGKFRISRAMIAKSLTFKPDQGALVTDLDADTLRRVADPQVKRVELAEPRNATVRLVKGRPKVIAAVNGTAVTGANLKRAVEPALAKSEKRVGDLELTGAKAAFSTADARDLKIKRVIGQFTTYFPYLEYRNINIGRAAELINGTVLKPGETFSLNKVVGERTRANGFTEGFIIKGGKFKKELGGGVSQSATTTYNAMFFAGLKDVQHQPHTLYIDRYPPGREATVAWPNLDLKFANDTEYGVLVQAYLVKAGPGKQGSLTVKMWSTKTYDKITSTTPKKSNFATGQDLTDDSANCEPMVPVPGFDADYQRLFYRDGKVVKRQSFHWRYAPTNKVTCTR